MNKSEHRKKLTTKIQNLKTQLETAHEELRALDQPRTHKWNTPIAAHEYYTIPGDPPGTMDIDRRDPIHIPAKFPQNLHTDILQKYGIRNYEPLNPNTKTQEIPKF